MFELVPEASGFRAPEIRDSMAWTSGRVSGLDEAGCASLAAAGAPDAVFSGDGGVASPVGLMPVEPPAGGGAPGGGNGGALPVGAAEAGGAGLGPPAPDETGV